MKNRNFIKFLATIILSLNTQAMNKFMNREPEHCPKIDSRKVAQEVLANDSIYFYLTESEKLYICVLLQKQLKVATILQENFKANKIERNKELLSHIYDNGLSLMHVAANYNDLYMAKILRRYGAEIETLSNKGLTPLYYATHDKHGKIKIKTDLAKYLIKNGAKWKILEKEVIYELFCLDIIESLG